jgi:hypothetical protein
VPSPLSPISAGFRRRLPRSPAELLSHFLWVNLTSTSRRVDPSPHNCLMIKIGGRGKTMGRKYSGKASLALLETISLTDDNSPVQLSFYSQQLKRWCRWKHARRGYLGDRCEVASVDRHATTGAGSLHPRQNDYSPFSIFIKRTAGRIVCVETRTRPWRSRSFCYGIDSSHREAKIISTGPSAAIGGNTTSAARRAEPQRVADYKLLPTFGSRSRSLWGTAVSLSFAETRYSAPS